MPQPAATLEADLSGRQMGDYQLLRRLGRGGMAEVYLAEQASLKRQVALKILRREFAADESYVKRFKVEAQAAAALVHGNIVQVYEVGCHDGLHYIAQEYVQGQNLREWMVRHGSPDLKLTLAILRQVASALAKAADQGVVHRDIKPENIMLTKSGEVKVADFGLARLAGAGEALNLTQVGITMGTPLYMSPEQVEGRKLDARSDIYSLGVTAYHMLSGQPPFRGETPLSIAVQHLRTPPERLETQRPELPAGLCRLVHKLLAKDPGHRHQHPREVLRELRALHIEGEVDDAEIFDDAELAVAASLSGSTDQLSQLMKTQSLMIERKPWWHYVLAASIGAFLLGALLAFVLREPFALAEHGGAGGIERMGTAREQYEYAISRDSPAAWQAVIDYYPNDTEIGWLAKRQLAGLYLQRDELELAMPMFEEMSAQKSNSRYRERAFGLAGQCVVLHIQGLDELLDIRLDELQEFIANLDESKRNAVLDAHMMRLIERVEKDKQRQDEAANQNALRRILRSLDVDTKGTGKSAPPPGN
jgi:serine/threonine-protein kinase